MKKGTLAIGTVTFLTVLCWLITQFSSDVSLLNALSQLLGAASLVGFACANAISARCPWLDSFFNGLDKAYNTHKWLGIASAGLALAHVVLALDHSSAPAAEGRTEHVFAHLGIPSGILFIVLLFIALVAKLMQYERWKAIHKFLALPYAIGVVHYYGSSLYDAASLSPFSLWMNMVNLIGVASAFYSIFLYEKIAFPFRYQVTALRTVAKDTIEITGKAAKKALTFRPGQFTFLKIAGKACRIPSHPFTLSGAPEPGAIQFTIKNLGIHTAGMVASLQRGDAFAVTASHGMFDYATGGRHQVWIAGGIGITPFRSFYLADIPESFSIDFFYAYHGEEEGVYLEELRMLRRKNLRVHLIDDTIQGFLTPEIIRQHLSGSDPVDIYFCGPKPMRESLRSALKNNERHTPPKAPGLSEVPASLCLRVRGFHFDEFKFGRG